jgi:hypothetical protein
MNLLTQRRPILAEIARCFAWSLALLAGVVAVLALSTLIGCGGEPFVTIDAPALDAGDAGELLEAAPDGATLINLDHDAGDAAPSSVYLDASWIDAGADAGELLEASASPDVATPPRDAGAGAVDAAHDAGAPALCCHIACGSGTLPSGFTCSGGPCVVGGACSYQTACGVVVTCP